jgi:hypothetical protein
MCFIVYNECIWRIIARTIVLTVIRVIRISKRIVKSHAILTRGMKLQGSSTYLLIIAASNQFYAHSILPYCTTV